MGFAAGSGSLRDKLAGAVASTSWGFPRGSAGWAHPQPKPEAGSLGGQMKSPRFLFPCPSLWYFLTDLSSQHWNVAVQDVLYKGSEAPCLHPTTEIPPSKPRIHFVCLLGIQAVVSSCLGSLCICFTQTLTGRLNLTEHTYAVEKGSKVLDSPHATLVPVHTHLPSSMEIICFTPRLSAGHPDLWRT